MVGDDSVSTHMPPNSYSPLMSSIDLNGADGITIINRVSLDLDYDITTPEEALDEVRNDILVQLLFMLTFALLY